jgi:mxaJ protein
MCSRCLEATLCAAALLLGLPAQAGEEPQATQAGTAAPLRVCADPDNFPQSRADGAGFENRIAALAADELKRPLEFAWVPQLRAFVRKSVGERRCDVWIGVPADLERLLTTAPYYRSSYVFVTPADGPPPLRSFDDPRLPKLRIGVQLIGPEFATTPPGHALAMRGATQRVVGYTVGGDAPAAARMVQALDDGALDAAVVWGPQAGWYARHAARPLEVRTAHPPAGLRMPFEFGIAMGVRRGDTALRDALQGVIDRRRADIDRVLDDYAVPRTDAASAR